MSPDQYKQWMDARTVHGGYVGGVEKPEHYTWRVMVDRCTKPNHAAYKYYGAKGITVCPNWMEYKNFIRDMGNRPSKDYSLDRIDNTKGYNKINCRWATRSEQQKNKSSTKWYSDGCFTGTLVECAKHLGISKELAFYRWKKWNSFEKEKLWLKLPSVK